MPRPSDPCCSRCRTPFGVCGSKGACEHHRAAQWDVELWELTNAPDHDRYDRDATKARAR